MEIVASQAHGVRERLGLDHDEVGRAVWVIAELTDGSRVRVSGPQAVALHVAVAWQRRFPMWPFRLPGVGVALDALYGAIARRRSRLPGVVPWCEQHPGECEERPSPSDADPDGGGARGYRRAP